MKFQEVKWFTSITISSVPAENPSHSAKSFDLRIFDTGKVYSIVFLD